MNCPWPNSLVKRTILLRLGMLGLAREVEVVEMGMKCQQVATRFAGKPGCTGAETQPSPNASLAFPTLIIPTWRKPLIPDKSPDIGWALS